MQLIQTVTLTGAQSSLTLSSIPQTFTDLKLVFSARASTADVYIGLGFNGVTTGYSQRYLYGTGTGTASDSAGISSDRIFLGLIPPNYFTANTFSNGEIYIPNYRVATNKSISADVVTENNGAESYQWLLAGLWSNTAAISSITLSMFTGNLGQHTSASLYGITAGSSGGVIVS